MRARSLFLPLVLAAVLRAQDYATLRPSPQQVEWQDLEIGVLFHFGPNTFMGREWGDGTADPKVFLPDQFNADQWMRAAKACGARYVVMVAKHHDGFALWPSRHTAYGVKSSPWKGGKGDAVREVADAAHKQGLRFGIYLSPWDRHEPAYRSNAEYDKYYLNQMTELVTHYGELTEFWLDGAGSEGHIYAFDEYLKRLRTYQPNTLVFADVGFLQVGDIRWVGNESGVANEENWNVVDRLGYLRYRPAEADTPVRKAHWFWHEKDESSLKSVEELLDIYHKTVGRGAQLVLGLAPDKRGLMPETDVTRLEEFGAALRHIYGRNLAPQGKPVNEASARAVDNDPDTYSTADTVEIVFSKPTPLDRVAIMEWLNDGQHIQKYAVEAYADGQWKRVSSGTSIGHKKIDIFPMVLAKGMRLRILSSVGAPNIREFQMFDGSRVP